MARRWKLFKRSLDEFVNPIYGLLRFTSISSYNSQKATKISTAYRCINLLSDSIASLPLNPYQYRDNWKYVNYDSGLYNLLNVQPNSFMSAFMFKKMIIVHMLTKGNAYIHISRNKNGKITELNLLEPDYIQVITDGKDVYYVNSLVSGPNNTYDKSQLIHLINYTVDGVTGISTITYAATTLGIAYSSEEHAENFWQSGANLSGILRPVAGATLNKTQQSAAKTAFLAQTSSASGGTSGSVVVLGDGLEYQPISVNPKDSQLLESRQFNVIEICRFFNVPPSLAYSETGKFATAEQQSLDFLNNSLAPLIEKIESEFFRKLFLPSEWNMAELKFDVENIFRMDAATRATYFSTLFRIGGYTTNEIREKVNAPYPVKGGNRAFIEVNLQPTDALIAEQVNVNKDAPIDNQVKKGDDTE